MQKRYFEHAFLVWSLVLPTLGIATGYLVSHAILPGTEIWFMVIGCFVGFVFAIRIASKPGSFHIALLGVAGAIIMCLITGIMTEYISLPAVGMGAVGGIVVGILLAYRKDVIAKIKETRSRRRRL